MKKKILIVFIALILIFGAALTYAAMNLNSLISKFKPDLEKIASQTLGMPVNIGNLEASVFPDTKILVKEFKLGGAEKSQAFKLNNLALSVKLSSLILSQKLEITKLTIDSPEITVTKTLEGMEISGLPKAGAKTAPAKKENSAQNKEAPPQSQAIGINLNSLEVNDASVVLKNFMPEKDLTLSDIDIKTAIALENNKIEVSNLELTSLLLNAVKLGVTSDSIVLDNNSGELNVPSLKVKLNDDTININAVYNLNTSAATSGIKSDGINLEKLITSLAEFVPPAVKEMNVKGSLKPDLKIKAAGSNYNLTGDLGLEKISAVAAGFNVTDLAGTFNLDASNTLQNIKTQDLGLSVNGSKIKILLDTALKFPEVNISKLVVNAFSGTLNTDGKILVGTPISFDLKNQVAEMQIVEIMNTLKPGTDMLVGKIEKATADLKGTLDANFMKNLSGNVFYVLTDGELKGFNIGGMALKAANNLSFISGSLYDKAQGKKELFDVANTIVKQSSAHINIGAGSMTTKDLTLTSIAYDLNANGRIGFDTSLNLNSNIIFTPDVSAKIVAGVKELAKALDQNQRLNMPLSIQGTPPAIIVIPDLQKLIELGAKNLLKDKAGEYLGENLEKKTGIKVKGLDKLLGF